MSDCERVRHNDKAPLTPPDQVHLGSVYLIRLEGEWLRGQIVVLDDTKMMVFFIDFGNYYTFPRTIYYAVRQLPAELQPMARHRRLPAAIHCFLSGVSNNSIHSFIRHRLTEKAEQLEAMHFLIRRWNQQMEAYEVMCAPEEIGLGLKSE